MHWLTFRTASPAWRYRGSVGAITATDGVPDGCVSRYRDVQIKLGDGVGQRLFGHGDRAAQRHGAVPFYTVTTTVVTTLRISLIARGKARVTSIETIERIGDGLRIPGAMLGLATRPWEGGKGTKPAREDESMYRRELLRTVLAAG